MTLKIGVGESDWLFSRLTTIGESCRVETLDTPHKLGLAPSADSLRIFESGRDIRIRDRPTGIDLKHCKTSVIKGLFSLYSEIHVMRSKNKRTKPQARIFRKVILEQLEDRRLLAADLAQWQEGAPWRPAWESSSEHDELDHIMDSSVAWVARGRAQPQRFRPTWQSDFCRIF